MNLSTKICGLNDEASVQACIDGGADFCGFMLYPSSPRAVAAHEAAALASVLPDNIHPVAVIVDMSDDEIDATLATFRPPFLQLHGSESPARVAEIRQRTGLYIIKAVPISDPADVFHAITYTQAADRLLLDARPPKDADRPGGHGVPFDWSILSGIELPIRWFLAGGLTVDNLKVAVHTAHARAVDVSSSVEASPGFKDPGLIQAFLAQSHRIEV